MMNTEEMSLSELFAASDEVGDKYLSEQEIAAREAALAQARERLDSYAFPGGYPLFYLDKQDNVLCPCCANEDRESVATHGINWEDPDLYCDECSERIESAYAEPEND